MNHKLTVIAHIRAKAGQETRVQEALLGLIEPTHAEAGCINYELHVSEEDARQFVFYENWMSESHVEAHANSAQLGGFGRMADEIQDCPVEITKWRML